MKIPKRPKTIQTHIKKYESQLRAEKRKYGGFDDSAGVRYILVPYYSLLHDWKGAVKSYRWFEKNFSTDIGEPFHLLCSALAHYHTGDLKTATYALRRAMFSNLHLIPRLLGREPENLDIGSNLNWSGPDSLDYAPPEYWDLWDDDARQWAEEIYESQEFSDLRNRYIEIERLLKGEPRGPKRSQLVEEKFEIAYAKG